MMEARRLAFRMIRPELPCSDLDASVNEFLRGKGYSAEDVRLHRTGHGFGLGNHEAPWLADGSTDVLAENMVISIEPGIYLKGVGGVRHSDTILVKRDGYELLTKSAIDLETLTIRGWRPFTRLKGRLVQRALRLESRRIGAA
jgi:Xaa-Pro dipeptidase